MLPETISAAIFVAGLTWLGYCYRQWESFPESADRWMRDHDQHRSGRQSELLTRILTFTLPDLARVYLTLEPAEQKPAVDRDALVAIAASIDAEPAVHDVRIREGIAKPVLLDMTSRLVAELPRLTDEVIVQPNVLEGVQGLGCYAVDLDQFRRRKERLALRYPLQAALLGVWLTGIVLAYLHLADWWTVEAAVAVALVPIAHGADLELRRHRLKFDLSAPTG